MDSKIISEKWVVEHAQVKRQIWHYKPVGKTEILDIHVTDEVVRTSVEITARFAKEISRTFGAVLQQTHYPAEDMMGADGEIIQFFGNFNLFGETWSPMTGIPSQMVELGSELGKLAQSNPETRQAHLKSCLDLSTKINTTLKNLEQVSPE